MGKSVKRGSSMGRGKMIKPNRIPRTTKYGTGGNTAPNNVGNTGITKGGESKQGPHWSHLPSHLSHDNASVKKTNRNITPAQKSSPKPTWDHLPSKPE